MPHPLILALLLGLVAWASPARAADPFAWTEPPPDEQLARDETVIPLGQGALLVPSITGSLNEPPVILVSGDEVRDLPTGKRVIVPPGRYTVIVSPGSPGQGIGQAIEVVEAQTTVVPVTWGALVILVTDERRVPNRNGYDLIRQDTGEPIGTGFGADTLQGETPVTWLLPPGVYRIVKPGASVKDLRNFSTVYVHEAGLVQYRLVTDRDTGDFLGAGILSPGELGVETSRERPWVHTLSIGADGSLLQQHNVIAVANQLVLTGNLFADGQLGYRRGRHGVALQGQVEEGATRIQPQSADPLPIVKTRDLVRADLLYTYAARPSLGPYARAAAQTQAFATKVLPIEDTTYALQLADGTTRTRVRAANEPLQIADPWQPTIIREGAGANLRAANTRWATLNVRLGLGLRQNQFGGSFVLADDAATPAVEYLQVESFQQQGVESTIVATARLPGWAVYATDVELFAPFDAFDAPAVEWRNTVSLRVSRGLAVNYYANVDYLPQVVDAVQLEHGVVLRLTWNLL